MILVSLNRLLLCSKASYIQSTKRLTSNLVTTIARGNHAMDQMEHIRSSIDNKVGDWKTLKTEILSMKGSLNEKNVDGVLLKVMINDNNLEEALSFAKYVIGSAEELNLGVTNGLLNLYYKLGLKTALTDEQKQFILDSYNKLYEKYEVLDSSTCESLLHALCVVDEWEKALKVLDDIYLSSKPTHSAFSILIATLFRLNKNKKALEIIQKSIQTRRSLTHLTYEAWIDYILRRYKTKKARQTHLEEICTHLSMNCVVMPEKTADKLKLTFHKLGWHARTTRIQKTSGQCVYCKSTLECLKLTENEFQLLQKTVKDKLIVGSDLLLKSSEPELKRFLKFCEETAPYDIVLDALNICYAVGKHKMDKVGHLTFVIEHFRQQNKKILLIGRKHMLKWPKMKYVLGKTLNFFTDDVSQDDPYFITATIMSGSHTDFVSKDLLRGHRFQLQDEKLRNLFQRWQWQHQWKVFVNRHGAPVIQSPLPVTPCAQKTDSTWHLPYELEEPTNQGLIKDGIPDWSSWLCLQPSKPEEIDTENRSHTEENLQSGPPKRIYHQNGPLKEIDRQNGPSKEMDLQYELPEAMCRQQGKPPNEIGYQNEPTKEMSQQNEPKEMGHENGLLKATSSQNGLTGETGRQNELPKETDRQNGLHEELSRQNEFLERGHRHKTVTKRRQRESS